MLGVQREVIVEHIRLAQNASEPAHLFFQKPNKPRSMNEAIYNCHSPLMIAAANQDVENARVVVKFFHRITAKMSHCSLLNRCVFSFLHLKVMVAGSIAT